MSTPPAAISLSRIRHYPVKSCRGHDLDSAVIEPWGIAGDRRWMLVDRKGVEVTARKHPRLLFVTPSIAEGGLLLERPGTEALFVPFPDASELVPVTIWKNPVDAAPAAAEASAWFSEVVGFAVRLVYLDDPTRRRTNPQYGLDTDVVTFADAFPLTLTSESSLADVNSWISPTGESEPLSMVRFRPSVVVTGAEAWEEDSWRRLRIGDALFRAVKASARCVLTTTDPDTAARGKEPLATLAQHRRWDSKAWFAINLVPDNPGAVIRIGDDVEVLERVASLEPQR
ncbi:MOSC domain-containing protein [Parafrigoribacterium soli]|uniref:MOSC domain-containing protein n=1 Tax=Parafrigoribacterium soli TaxID=3144663 RepID=UPI0032ECDCC6